MGYEWNGNGDHPHVSARAYVHPTALLIGRVEVGEGVFIGPYAVLRADERGPDGTVCPIVVGDGSNVQDGVIVHAVGGTGVTIGPGSSIAHGAVIHGPCRIEAGCFVGFRSVVYGAELGGGTAVMHGCLVEGVHLPAGRLVVSGTTVRTPDMAASLGSVDRDTCEFMRRVRSANDQLVAGRVPQEETKL